MAKPRVRVGIVLPANFDPYDEKLKKAAHPLADAKNLLHEKRGRGYLVCGARVRKGTCLRDAGRGTVHLGYGRCSCHDGTRKEESKVKLAVQGTIHGLYSFVLLPHERDIYDRLAKEDKVSLKEQIFLLQTKLLSYLRKWAAKYEAAFAEHGDRDKAEAAIRVTARRVSEHEGEEGVVISETTVHYEAGSIEDKNILLALDRLAKLVDKQVKLDPNGGGDIVAAINAELRAASHGEVKLAWANRMPQHRIMTKE